MSLRNVLLTLLLATSSVSSPVSRSSNSSAPAAWVRNGTIIGKHSSEYNQDFFLGVPYAQPPVSQLRFANPRSLNTSFAETYNATEYSKACVGYGSDQWNYQTSEDCLYLNIVRPAGFEGQKLPVAFWIHGGGFTEGSGIDQRYNLSFMIQNSVQIGKPIIGVSINYRLSAWGFLSSEELIGTGATNMGLRDQRLALHWVQENIEAFGGNKAQVTIFGESAGGASVGAHLTAYGGRDDGLFRAAIMESGNPISYSGYNASLYQPVYDRIVKGVNCSQSLDTLACLRQTPYVTLNAVINGTNSPIAGSFSPNIDGDFLERYGSIQLEEGQFVKVPIIDGCNSDEGTAFSPVGINTESDLYNAIASGYSIPPSLVEGLVKAYPDDAGYLVPMELPASYRPGAPYGAQYRRSAAVFGDAVFVAPRRKTVETWASNDIPAYSYRFNAIPAGIPQDSGVTHFQEVAFVFYNLQGAGYIPAAEPPFTDKPTSYAALSQAMNSAWIGFVHDLTPGNDWPQYSIENPQNFVWDANVTSHAEPDTWRSEGIKLINDNAAAFYR